MKTTEQRAVQIKEVIDLLKREDPLSKPSYISINDEKGSFINYPGKRHSEKVTFDDAVRLHEIYPDVQVIQWTNENSKHILSNPVIIDFRHD